MDLNEIRIKIDTLDTELLALLAQRLALSKPIGEYKRANQLPYFQPDREKEVLLKRIEQAKALGLDEKFVTELMTLIMDRSKELQAEE